MVWTGVDVVVGLCVPVVVWTGVDVVVGLCVPVVVWLPVINTLGIWDTDKDAVRVISLECVRLGEIDCVKVGLSELLTDRVLLPE